LTEKVFLSLRLLTCFFYTFGSFSGTCYGC
jgi:hypothetical protein